METGSLSFYFPSGAATRAKMQLFQALGQGGVILFLGKERSGKTSFIRHFLTELQGEIYHKAYIPLYALHQVEEPFHLLATLLDLPSVQRKEAIFQNLYRRIQEDLQGGKFWIVVFDPWDEREKFAEPLLHLVEELTKKIRNHPLALIFLSSTQDPSAFAKVQKLATTTITLLPWNPGDVERFLKFVFQEARLTPPTFPEEFLSTLQERTGGRLDLLKTLAENLLFFAQLYQWEEIPATLLLHPEILLPSPSPFPLSSSLPSPTPTSQPSPPPEEELELPIPLEETLEPPPSTLEISAPTESPSSPSLDLDLEVSSLETELEPPPAPPPPPPKPTTPPLKKAPTPPPPPQTPTPLEPEEDEINLDALLKEVEATPAEEEDVDALLEKLSAGSPSPPKTPSPKTPPPSTPSRPSSPTAQKELDEVDDELDRLLRELPE